MNYIPYQRSRPRHILLTYREVNGKGQDFCHIRVKSDFSNGHKWEQSFNLGC